MPVREQLLPARSQAEEKIEIGKKKKKHGAKGQQK